MLQINRNFDVNDSFFSCWLHKNLVYYCTLLDYTKLVIQITIKAKQYSVKCVNNTNSLILDMIRNNSD